MGCKALNSGLYWANLLWKLDSRAVKTMKNYDDWARLVAKNLQGEADLIAAIDKDELDDAAARTAFISAVLEPFLPGSFAIGSGRVVDAFGNYSDHLDIIIYNREFPRIGLRSTQSVYLYESVLAAFVIRGKLLRKPLHEAMDACASLAMLNPNIDKPMHQALAKKNGLTINQNGEYEHSDPMRTGRFHLIGRPPAFIYGFTGVKNSYKQLSDHIDIWLQHRHEKQGDVELKVLPAVIATQGCFAWRNSAPLAIKSARLLGLGTDAAPVRLIVMHLMHLLNRRLSTKTDSFGLKPNLNAYMKQFSPPEFLSTLGKLSSIMPAAEIESHEETASEESPVAEAEQPVAAEATPPAPVPTAQASDSKDEPEPVAEQSAQADEVHQEAAPAEQVSAAEPEVENIQAPVATEAEPEPAPTESAAAEAPTPPVAEASPTEDAAEVQAEPAPTPVEPPAEPEPAPVQQAAEEQPVAPAVEAEAPSAPPVETQPTPETAQQPAPTLGSGIPSSFDTGGTPGSEAEDYVPEFIVEESFPEGGEIEEEPMPVNTSAGLSGGPDFPTLEDPEEDAEEEVEQTLVMEAPKPSETHTASEIKKAINEYKEEQQAEAPASQESDDDQFAQTLVLNSPPPQMPTESEKPANLNGSGSAAASADEQPAPAAQAEEEEDPYTQTLVMSSPPPMAKPNGGQQAAASAENPEPFPQLAPEKKEEVDPFTSTIPQ